jgi:hypothetical protein
MADESESELTEEIKIENYNEDNSDETMESLTEKSDEIIQTTARVRTGENFNFQTNIFKQNQNAYAEFREIFVEIFRFLCLNCKVFLELIIVLN